MSSDQINSVFAANALIDGQQAADIAALKARVPASGASSLASVALSDVKEQITLGVYPTQTVLSCPANNSGKRTYSTYDAQSDCHVRLGIDAVKSVSAATTLLASESGSIVRVTVGSNYTIALPALTAAIAGTRYRFVNVSAGAFTVVIDSGTAAAMKGSVLSSAGAAATSAILLGQQKVNFTATSLLGDWVEVWTDGTFWYADGRSTAAAGLASAA